MLNTWIAREYQEAIEVCLEFLNSKRGK